MKFDGNSVMTLDRKCLRLMIQLLVIVATLGGLHLNAAIIPLEATNQIIAWGDNVFGQATVPNGIGNVVAAVAGEKHSLALKENGLVIGWGYNAHGQINPPNDLSNATAISAGGDQSLALKNDGTVIQWGEMFTNAPPDLNDVAAISVGKNHCLALRSNGTVVAWGAPGAAGNQVPTNLSGVKAVAAGWNHNLALKENGTVVAWGANGAELGWHLTEVPDPGTNVVAIAAGALHSLALKSDGTVVAWGNNSQGETNVPPGLSNVVAIAAGMGYSLATKADGSVVAWGAGDFGQLEIPSGLGTITSLATGGRHALVIRAGQLTPVIQKQPADRQVPIGASVSFDVLTSSLLPAAYQWQFNGTNIEGATSTSWVIASMQQSNAGNYSVIISNSAGSITSRTALLSVVPPPVIASFGGVSNLWLRPATNLVLSIIVSNPAPLSFQWRWNGTNLYAQTHANFTNIFREGNEGIYTAHVTNAAGADSVQWSVRFLSPGHVVGWGRDGQAETDVPFNLPTISAVAVGQQHSVALKDGGIPVAWGNNARGQTSVPLGLSNVVSIAAGDNHSLALKTDGKVVAWGDDSSSQTEVPPNLSNVVAVAAGGDQSIALAKEGKPVAWGNNAQGQTNVPANLSNVTAVAVGGNFDVALKNDGTVTAWGDNSSGQTNVPADLSNVVAVAAGGEHALALKSDGTLSAWGANINGQAEIPAGLDDVIGIAAGSVHSLALKNNGTVVGWGDNSHGQTDVMPELTNVRAVAAGGNQSLAVIFSQLVLGYPQVASNDLLIVYNTNSADSVTIKDYYLQHRPGVANANILGVGCTTNETTTPLDFTNQIREPVAAWASAHPTKRPACILLLPDLPVRVNNTVISNVVGYASAGVDPSVSVKLARSVPGWQPLITHLNMGDTNACKAYIDKLARNGGGDSNGQLIIGPGGDTNVIRTFVLDDEHDQNGYGYSASDITNGLLQAGIRPPAVHFSADTTGHITNATNVTAYFSFAAHSSLQGTFPTNNSVRFHGASDWFLIHTYESYNGHRSDPDFSTYIKWFSHNVFGGMNYSNTPVGAIAHTDEPTQFGVHDGQTFFRLWGQGKIFATCAWQAMHAHHFLAVGDPFVVSTNGVAPADPPMLLASRNYPNLTLKWNGEHTLQSSTNANGPFADIIGATSPFMVNMQGKPGEFFRLKP